MRRFAWVFGAALVAAASVGVAKSVSDGESASAASPAGWLAYVRSGDVFVLNTASGQTRRLTHDRVAQWFGDAVPAGDVAVSPDGAKVAYTVSMRPVSGNLRLARTIYVQPVDGGRARDVTPWRSVGWSGGGIQDLPRHIDPHWIDAAHLEYTDDLDSNGQSLGVVMRVDFVSRSHGRLMNIPSGAAPDVDEPFVFAHGYAAFPVLDMKVGHTGSCSWTTDLVRGSRTTGTRLTATADKDETPLDIDEQGDVLAVRSWISSGRHDGLCTFGGPNRMTSELVVLRRNGRRVVLKRFAPVPQHLPAQLPRNIDAAWSPDGKEIAYNPPAGELVILTLADGSQHVVARGVEALDW